MNAEDLCGTVLGTCTLQEVIGRGGMGAVYLAQQSRPRRQVAVKVLLPITTLQPHQQKAFLERFRRETDAAASLEHPNITPVHEYGERDGLAYLVMAYVSGGTLRDELDTEGKLPLTRVVNYLEQMAAALDFAHERKVVHRDIKPANILMTPEKRLLLTDFGLVKIMIDGQNPNPLSEVGMPMGTPDYMAPEQVIGAEVDARADIYSLGVLLYHMVTGAPPFQGETPMKVALQHVHTPPPLPRLSRPDLPPAAEQVILRALTKRPADRYTSARDLATTFRLALEAAGVQVEISSMSNEDRGSGNRRRGLFDPVWRSSISPTPQPAAETADAGQKSPTPTSQKEPGTGANIPVPPKAVKARHDIVAQTSMTLPSFSGILTEDIISNIQAAANNPRSSSNLLQNAQKSDFSMFGLASDVQENSPSPIAPPPVHTPLPPVYEVQAEKQVNASFPQGNPQSEPGIINKPQHKLLFSPSNLRFGHKTNLQSFQSKQTANRIEQVLQNSQQAAQPLAEQNTRQTDKGPAFSARSMNIGKQAQQSRQIQDAAPDQAAGSLPLPNNRGPQMHQPAAANGETMANKSGEINTTIVAALLQKVTAALSSKSQPKSWQDQLQQTSWQDLIKNNKKKALLIALVLIILCSIVIILLSHAGSPSSTTGLKQHGYQTGLNSITMTNATTTTRMSTSITLIDPSTYHIHEQVDGAYTALPHATFVTGVSGQNWRFISGDRYE
jgi:serine/threonine protein kinase